MVLYWHFRVLSEPIAKAFEEVATFQIRRHFKELEGYRVEAIFTDIVPALLKLLLRLRIYSVVIENVKDLKAIKEEFWDELEKVREEFDLVSRIIYETTRENVDERTRMNQLAYQALVTLSEGDDTVHIPLGSGPMDIFLVAVRDDGRKVIRFLFSALP